jgi:amphiphysin
VAAKRAPPPPPLKPKPAPVNYVVALYDFAAQTEGDLEFKVGDRIEVVERTESTEDWWTGRLGGRTGVFPGNVLFRSSPSWLKGTRSSDQRSKIHR